jgi:hypothetical protein
MDTDQEPRFGSTAFGGVAVFSTVFLVPLFVWLVGRNCAPSGLPDWPANMGNVRPRPSEALAAFASAVVVGIVLGFIGLAILVLAILGSLVNWETAV